MAITRQTSDTIVVQEVLHVTPPPPLGPTTAPMDWQPNLPVAPIPSEITPETIGGSPPPVQDLPAGTPRPLQTTGLLYLTSLDIGNTTFAVYDPATDSWTTLAPFETGCQMAVSGAGQLYAYNHTAGSIDLYDPATDTWTPVMAAPSGATGQYCNLEITAEGEFLYTQGNATTLWYTAGGAWNTLSLPFQSNVMGDYDPTTDQYVVGERTTTNAHMIDVHTWAITDFTSPIGNGEWARFGVVMGNRYYFEAGGSNIHSFDLSSPASPPLDHGVSPGWYNSAAGDRANAVIYSASLNGTQLNLFDTVTGLLTPLTGYAASMNHSSLAFVVPQGSAYAQVEIWDPAHLQLLDWAATGGSVITGTGHLTWTGQILEPMTVTLTKWFHVEPCTWTQTLLQEELWLDEELLAERPVLINKLPPDLWIDSAYDPMVCPGTLAEFMLGYGNLGGYENMVTVRNEFPPEAPFASSDPPPDDVDPAGLWAEWWVGDLPQDAEGYITVTVAITDTALPGDLPAIYDWIIDHVGQPADMTAITFTVGVPDIAVDPPMLWTELCPDETTTMDVSVCNDGDCLLTWALSEMTPTLWLSEDPISGTLPAGLCQTVTASFDAAGLLPGDYFADLIIDSNDPAEPQVLLPVTLTVQQPAEILDVTTVITDLTVAFTAEVTGTPPIDFLWDLGDGSLSTETNPIHTYAAAGCYSVSLDIANACGLDSWIGEVCVGVCIPPSGADFGWSPKQPVAGEMVHFTGTVAAGTEPLTYTWAFGDGGTGSGATPTYTYAMTGTYAVRMTVTNECGEVYATFPITIVAGCVEPTGADFSWLPLNPDAGQVVAFTGSTTGGTLPITYAWDLGDGGTGAGNPINHTYTMTGTYTVVMTATNACGSDVATHDVVVSGAAPMSYIYLPIIVRPAGP
jgi:PKD repeat protein